MRPAVEETAISEFSSASLLQSRLWARFKSDFGWRSRVFRVKDGPWSGLSLLALSRPVVPGITLAYVPHAPGVATDGRSPGAGDLAGLGASIAGAMNEGPLCVRFDPLLPAHSLDDSWRGVPRLRRAPIDVQPSSTVIVELGPEPDTLLAAMHKKNRYNIRLAERHGVEVTEGSREDISDWYELYRTTAARDRIAIHPLRYYQRLFELAREDDEVSIRLYLARHEGDLLGGVIVAETGRVSTYLYGASANEKRNLMPNYALQWHAMLKARESGRARYDLFGVPHADDPSHPMHGLYRFKTGFGGELIHRIGSWDAIARPAVYAAYRGAEGLRSFYFHRLRKRNAR